MLDNVTLTSYVAPKLQLSFITAEDQVRFTQFFKLAVGNETALSGDKARDILSRSGLDAPILSYIW
jgi:actin cytoskeleton-regulatory complex protein PAN1